MYVIVEYNYSSHMIFVARQKKINIFLVGIAIFCFCAVWVPMGASIYYVANHESLLLMKTIEMTPIQTDFFILFIYFFCFNFRMRVFSLHINGHQRQICIINADLAPGSCALSKCTVPRGVAWYFVLEGAKNVTPFKFFVPPIYKCKIY